jgi:hypothetical protein
MAQTRPVVVGGTRPRAIKKEVGEKREEAGASGPARMDDGIMLTSFDDEFEDDMEVFEV